MVTSLSGKLSSALLMTPTRRIPSFLSLTVVVAGVGYSFTGCNDTDACIAVTDAGYFKGISLVFERRKFKRAIEIGFDGTIVVPCFNYFNRCIINWAGHAVVLQYITGKALTANSLA